MSVVPAIRGIRTPGESNRWHQAVSFGLVRGLAGWIAREIRVRRDMRRLATFDDHMLRDIGLARSDIEGAVRRGHDNHATAGRSRPPGTG